MEGDPGLGDEILWGQIADGDGEAFGVLFDRHYERVRRHALKILGVSHLAEDVAAVVFYEAWRKRATVRIVGGSTLRWLLVTANYAARNVARQQRRYQQFLNHLPVSEDAPDVAESVAEADELRIMSQDVRKAFSALNTKERDALTLCVIERLSIQEAATVLGIAAGTVKSRVHRAKARLALYTPR